MLQQINAVVGLPESAKSYSSLMFQRLNDYRSSCENLVSVNYFALSENLEPAQTTLQLTDSLWPSKAGLMEVADRVNKKDKLGNWNFQTSPKTQIFVYKNITLQGHNQKSVEA